MTVHDGAATRPLHQPAAVVAPTPTAREPARASQPEPTESSTSRRPRLLLRLLAGALSGLALALAFPPYDLWVLAPVAVAGLALACRGLNAWRGAFVGLVAGLVFFLLLLEWMRVIGPDAWVLLALLEAAFLAALGAGLSLVIRLPGWPIWVACLWVAEELARSRVPFGGFPWGRLAFSQTATPYTPWAAVGGAALVSFAVGLSGALLAWALTARSRRVGALAAAGLAALVPAAAAAVPVPTGGERIVTAAVVQGNVPRTGLDFFGQREAVLRNHVDATRRLAGLVRAGTLPRPDLVVWPENASDIDPFADAAAAGLIDAAVRDVGVPTLVGAVVAGPDPQHVQNMGIVWDPQTGPGERYVKRHPVPFGEYIPFRDRLSGLIGRLDRIPRDFYAADRPGVLELGPARVGDVICFEVAYDDLLRDVVDGGADVLVVQTNNATYGRTGQPEQQLAISRLRAVEHGRAVLVAATSGISAVIAPDGAVLDRSADFTRDLLVERVPLREAVTLADRVGATPEWALAGVGLLAVAVAVAVGRRGRRTGVERSGP